MNKYFFHQIHAVITFHLSCLPQDDSMSRMYVDKYTENTATVEIFLLYPQWALTQYQVDVRNVKMITLVLNACRH